MTSIFDEAITVEAMQIELRQQPWRLEEEYGREDVYGLDNGNTPLISSALHGNIAVVKFLLSLGANVEARNKACDFHVVITYLSKCF